ncbi:MAG: Fe-S protein assembly co-chaperone HscB [Rickettsiales bacterium]|mgnify:CR=1 FL=1|nr:Fe-S protein assembly co-chaperone HscB [Rickettsiales bacterium]
MTSAKNCWNCKATIKSNDFFCNKCNKIQKPLDLDEFEVFGIKKVFLIDLNSLEDSYLKLQTKLHPDRFVNSTEKEREFSNHHSSKINESYKLLINNVTRANIILKSNGYDIEKESRTFGDDKMLEEIMDLQSECMLAETENSKKKIGDEIKKKIDQTIQKLDVLFKKKSWKDAYKQNVKLSYLEKMKKNLS